MTPEIYMITRQVNSFFSKHHAVVVISALGLLLAGAIYLMYDTTKSSFEAPTSIENLVTNFDQKAIDKIDKLRDRDNIESDIELPSTRSNPFSE